jgi:hypothetical protein
MTREEEWLRFELSGDGEKQHSNREIPAIKVKAMVAESELT